MSLLVSALQVLPLNTLRPWQPQWVVKTSNEGAYRGTRAPYPKRQDSVGSLSPEGHQGVSWCLIALMTCRLNSQFGQL